MVLSGLRRAPQAYKEHNFKPPQLTEEEDHFTGIPKEFRCDICRIVAYELQQGFRAAEQNR